MQMHVMFAGWVAALSLAALGLSIRALNAPRRQLLGVYEPLDRPYGDASIAAALSPGESRTYEVRRDLIETSDAPRSDPPVREIPAARFWLLVALLGVMTAFGGLWVADMFDYRQILEELKEERRVMAHVVLGGSIIVLALLLAMVARWSRHKVILSFFALLMLVALAGQIWVGTLMLFDGNQGHPLRPNSDATIAASSGEHDTTGEVRLDRAAPATAPATRPATQPGD